MEHEVFGVGGASLVAAFYGGGGLLFLITAPIWVLAAAITWIPVAGRPLSMSTRLGPTRTA